MESFGSLVLPALISTVLGVLTAFITTSYNLWKNFRMEKRKENDRLSIEYLHPLLVAAQDYLERTVDLRRRRHQKSQSYFLAQSFAQVVHAPDMGREDFHAWANDTGFFAVSCLYITAVYFAYAGKVRQRYPFFELKAGANNELLAHISDVRLSAGGKFGIWEDLQDSLGDYLIHPEADRVKNYREFCEMLSDPKEYVFLNRLVLFYRDILLKLEDQLDNIELALKALIRFLMKNLEISGTSFSLTQVSIDALRKKGIAERHIASLNVLMNETFGNQTDFFNALANELGQDATDDLKPSILRCAEKIRQG